MGTTISKQPISNHPSPESGISMSVLPEPSIFTCKICIEPIPKDQKFKNENLCAHSFCIDCVTKYITYKVLDDSESEVACPEPTCKFTLDPLACRDNVPPQTFIKWCDNLCRKAVLGLDHSYCPNNNCSVMVINECPGDVNKSTCPDCKNEFCFECGVKWHAGYRCEEISENMDQNDIQFGVLAEQRKWRRCPRCHHCIDRVTGCNIVKCRCGTYFCYKCGKMTRTLCNCDRATATIGIICWIIIALISHFIADHDHLISGEIVTIPPYKVPITHNIVKT